MIRHLGYCCINLSLKDKGISTNRTMTMTKWKSLPKDQRMEVVSARALQNLKDLVEIMKWNVKNDVNIYRLSSAIFPMSSEYELSSLPNFTEHLKLLQKVGTISKEFVRVGFHPGPFNVLASPHNHVVSKAIKELDQHSEILDYMGFNQSDYNSINIHVGGAYGDKESALARFANNFGRLQPSTQRRLVVENDDKKSMYTVKDLHWLHRKVDIPITFDFHHHWCAEDPMPMEEALEIAVKTWKTTALTHYASCKKIYENGASKKQAHADYIYEEIPNILDIPYDVELESKAKDLSLLQYRKLREEGTLLERNSALEAEFLTS